MNKMYEYLKNHAYISYNKKSTYEFELSEERAKCIANKYDNLTCELQKENQELKKQLEVGEQQYNDLVEEKEKLFEEVNYTVIPNCDIKSVIDKYENQQKKFIKYLEEKEKQFDMIGDPINSGACCGILNKYKEIIGDDK